MSNKGIIIYYYYYYYYYHAMRCIIQLTRDIHDSPKISTSENKKRQITH